jgi:phage baseplate assembly protein W
MVDIDRRTGAVISNEASVLQSVEIILTTRIGELVMLRQFGAGIVELLGRAATPELFAAYRMLIMVAIDLWEPRLRVRGVYVKTDAAAIMQGHANIRIEADYMPAGHKGDTQVAKSLVFSILFSGNQLNVVS